MEVPKLQWKIENYILEIVIDFESLKREYGVYDACSKYPPMVREVHRIGQKYIDSSAVAVVLSLQSELKAKNTNRKYRIPINYISFTTAKFDHIDWISRDDSYDIPLILDCNFHLLSDELLVNFNCQRITIGDFEYLLCRPFNSTPEKEIDPLIVHEGTCILSLVKSEEGYKFPGCGEYRILFSHDSNIMYKEYNVVTYKNQIIDSSYKKALEILDFRGSMNATVYDDLVYRDKPDPEMKQFKSRTGMLYYKIVN